MYVVIWIIITMYLLCNMIRELTRMTICCRYGIGVWYGLGRIVFVIVLQSRHPILLLRRVSTIGRTCCRNKCRPRAPNQLTRESFFFSFFWNLPQDCLPWEVGHHAHRLRGIRFRHNRSNLHKQLPSTLAQRPAGPCLKLRHTAAP